MDFTDDQHLTEVVQSWREHHVAVRLAGVEIIHIFAVVPVALLYWLIGRKWTPWLHVVYRYPFIATRFIVFYLLDIAFFTINPFLHTCSNAIGLFGKPFGDSTWPCQRDQMISWYNNFLDTGSAHLGGLAAIATVRYFVFGLVITIVWSFLYPYLATVSLSLIPAGVQTCHEVDIEMREGQQAREKEEAKYDQAVRSVWGEQALTRVQCRYHDLALHEKINALYRKSWYSV